MRTILVLMALVLAGCADPSTPDEAPDDDFEVEVDDDTGAIRGVVVDQAIMPVMEAKVVLTSMEDAETLTDVDGRFSFSKVPPGAHVLVISKLVYEEITIQTNVEAGEAQPSILRIQISRLHDQEPWSNTVDYRGHIGCAYALPLISSTCANDYTRLDPTGTSPGGCLPQVTGVIDQREYRSDVQGGWQSIVWEMDWDSSVSGTSEELGLTVSYVERIGASHWYASQTMGKPFRMQVDLGVDGPGIQKVDGQPEQIAPEGQDDLWNMVKSGSGFAVQQDFTVYQTNFYYAPSPEGWSFIAGDEPPF